MIIMPIIMVSPVLALLLFYYLPFKTDELVKSQNLGGKVKSTKCKACES
jgi:hypothetical protein